MNGIIWAAKAPVTAEEMRLHPNSRSFEAAAPHAEECQA